MRAQAGCDLAHDSRRSAPLGSALVDPVEAQAEADKYKREKAFFGLSLLYLFLHFGAILAEAALQPYGFGGWPV